MGGARGSCPAGEGQSGVAGGEQSQPFPIGSAPMTEMMAARQSSGERGGPIVLRAGRRTGCAQAHGE